MKLSNHKKSSPKGFSLMELLVVISIIAALGGLSYGPILRHLNTADINKTVKVCKDLTFSITGFEMEYDHLPYTGTGYPTDDTSYVTSTPAFLNVLMGKDTVINDKGKEFFTANQSDGGDGLVYAAGALVSLIDRWGNPYSIRLDYNGDGIINATLISTPPATGTAYKTELYVDDAIAASPGKDTIFNDVKDAKSW